MEKTYWVIYDKEGNGETTDFYGSTIEPRKEGKMVVEVKEIEFTVANSVIQLRVETYL